MRLSRPRPAALTGALLALVFVTSACGGGEAGASADSGSSTTPTDSATPTAEATATSAPPDGYLPVPSGVTLTDPGTRLQLKESATAAWAPRQDLVGVLDVAVTRIDATTVQASLAAFDLKGDEQRSTPYFVQAKVTNVGDTDLGARQVPLYFLDGRGVLIAPTGVARDFEACPGSILPAIFAPGDETKTCLIFLAPEGATLQSIMFRPPEGIVPLQWTGKVTDLKGDSKQNRSKGGQR